MAPTAGSKRQKPLLLAVIGAVLIQLAPLWLVKEQIRNGSSDFSAYYSAGRIVASGQGSRLYDLNVQREAQRIFPQTFGRPALLPFNHPPFEALIFAPLALLPYGSAFLLWLGCNLAMWIGTLFLLRPYLPSLASHFDLVLIAASLFAPLQIAVAQGQDSLVVLLFFALCLGSLIRNRIWLAGSALGLAMLKPQLALPAMLVLALAHERRLRLLAGFFSTCLALGLLSVGVAGWRATAAYPRVLVTYVPETPGIIHPASMPNLRGLFHALLGELLPLPLVYVSVALASVLLLGLAVAAWRGSRRRNSHLGFALVVTAAVLVSFHGNVHDSALLLLPALLASNYLFRHGVNTTGRAFLAASVAILLALPLLTGNRPILCCVTLGLFAAIGCELLQDRAAGLQPLGELDSERHLAEEFR